MVLTTVHLCVSAPVLGESAVVGEVGLLVVVPPSPRFALLALDAGVVGQPVTRFLPGSRCPAGTVPGPKRVRRPDRGLPQLRRRSPSRSGPPVPTASHCGPRRRSPNSNHSRASLRVGASQEPPPRQGTHPEGYSGMVEVLSRRSTLMPHSSLRACWRMLGAVGSAGWSLGVVRLVRVVRTREPSVPGGGGAVPMPRPCRSSCMAGRRLACRDAVGLLGPLACGWTTCVRLDHLCSVGPPYFVNQVAQRHSSGPSRSSPPWIRRRFRAPPLCARITAR